MKFFLSPVLACLLYCSFTNAQTPVRNVHFNFIAKDSIKLAFNDGYDLIEDSCSSFTRYAHINMSIGRKYVGKIKDVSRLDPNVTVAEGTYNDAGQKQGLFTTHYLNGQLQAKGSFEKNKYAGKWELYYDDGKPKLFFEADGDDINVTDYWDNKGIKLVDNGNGEYKITIGTIYWKGKLLNGRPNGNWSAIATDDVTKREFITEKFKYGVFQKGRSPAATYTDKSHMQLVPESMLPFIHAEDLRTSKAACGVKIRHIVRAQYRDGTEEYIKKLYQLLGNSFNPSYRVANQNQFSVECEVNEKGSIDTIIGINISSADKSIVGKDFLIVLKRLPPLEPATVDGVPSRQKIVFSFTFNQLNYRFNIRFAEVKI